MRQPALHRSSFCFCSGSLFLLLLVGGGGEIDIRFIFLNHPPVLWLNETKGKEKRENSADLLENKMMIQLVARSATIHNQKLRSRNSIECRFPRSDGNSGKGRRRPCDFFHFIQPVSVFFFFKYVTPPQKGVNHHNFPRRAVVNCDWERNFVFSRRRWWWFSVAADDH